MNKQFYFLLLICLIIFEAVAMPSHHSKMSQEGNLMYAVIKDFAKRMKYEKNLQLEAIGGGVDNGINEFTLGFRREGLPLNKKESETLIVLITEEFISEVNSNEMIRPYLRDYPISNTNVDMGIVNYDFKGNVIETPNVAIVCTDKDKIVYFYKGPKDIYDYKDERESYEEALKKIKQ
ncbi:hypothetical protein [Candidatus Protochlamydia amoebophila]|uniref:Uncharacterized protein n=1 Tax=Protochlamydia amoebophila (strain UWE25) TaxID=264201 RepID=A0A2P9H9M0_PARUW|nr:hypothetical protein [Candidatus Protochlamydia amoebophila]SPJ31698.1 unnamed protein product [Candidatus Protochlamydia amoebophila UWE25]